MDYLTPDEMREVESRAAARGLSPRTLMENAGRAVAAVIEERLSKAQKMRALIVCGTGNNGGDGFVVAKALSKRWNVLVLLIGTPSAIKTEEARDAWLRAEGLVVSTEDEKTLQAHRKYFDRADVIVDAILGTGARGPLREPAASAVRMINGSKGFKVAVDIPSGLDPLTGDHEGPVVKADLTVALHRAKVGLRGRDEYTGEVTVVPIGIDG
jgi:hydroxyethylthiazole kinase-like uncharacterized protein yjeF